MDAASLKSLCAIGTMLVDGHVTEALSGLSVCLNNHFDSLANVVPAIKNVIKASQ
mgnify:CR=1 FL=1